MLFRAKSEVDLVIPNCHILFIPSAIKVVIIARKYIASGPLFYKSVLHAVSFYLLTLFRNTDMEISLQANYFFEVLYRHCHFDMIYLDTSLCRSQL